MEITIAVLGGIAEHLYGLHGPGVVTAVKIGLVAAVVALAGLGVRRVLRFRRLSEV